MSAHDAPGASTIPAPANAPGSQPGYTHVLCLVGPDVSIPQETQPFTHFVVVNCCATPSTSSSNASESGSQAAVQVIAAVQAAVTQYERTTITIIVGAGDSCTHPHPSTPNLPTLPETAQSKTAKQGPAVEVRVNSNQGHDTAPAGDASLLPPWYTTITRLRTALPTAFLVLWHPLATEHARMRLDAFAAGASMVTHSKLDLQEALTHLASQTGTGALQCEWCGLQHLSPPDYWTHQPLYHIYEPNKPGLTCPICMEEKVPNLAVHLHEMHNPEGPHPEVRTNAGSAVIMHRKEDNKFLMVQEFALQGMWLPGGGNDPGERLTINAMRECWEEAGQEAELKGLLEVAYDLKPSPPWRLAVMYAVRRQDQERPHPKTVPDFESAGACWVGVDEIDHLPLRNDILPKAWFARIAAGDYGLLPFEFPEASRAIFEGSEGGEKLAM